MEDAKNKQQWDFIIRVHTIVLTKRRSSPALCCCCFLPSQRNTTPTDYWYRKTKKKYCMNLCTIPTDGNICMSNCSQDGNVNRCWFSESNILDSSLRRHLKKRSWWSNFTVSDDGPLRLHSCGAFWLFGDAPRPGRVRSERAFRPTQSAADAGCLLGEPSGRRQITLLSRTTI